MKPLSELVSPFFEHLAMQGYDTPRHAASDKLCFEHSVSDFLKTGRKEDAFVVYFCFSDIFRLFGKGYENTKKLIEMLSDHEYHSGELLTKHRDHYSHSVYVFSLGLAMYEHEGLFRETYLAFYGLEDDGAARWHFLKQWGMVALFHDIGYPFQLAHEQIKTYTMELWGRKGNSKADKEFNEQLPSVAFRKLDRFFFALDDDTEAKLLAAFPSEKKFGDINGLLAYGLKLREGYDARTIARALAARAAEPEVAVDHGYFSAVILAHALFNGPDFAPDIGMLDVLTAILLHNSFNKYSAPWAHPIDMKEHPLAYLIILCDELQSWDRLAYGKVSKRDPIAWDIHLEISAGNLRALYSYDSYLLEPTTDENGNVVDKPKLNKNALEMSEHVFLEKIFGTRRMRGDEYTKERAEAEGIKFQTGYIVTPLHIDILIEDKPRRKRSVLYASDDSFINLCDLAKAIHATYSDHCRSLSGPRISEDFGKLSLEYKYSNIQQAKSYAYKLELISCFYSSKDLDYPVVTDFNDLPYGAPNDMNLEFLCREEHVRWVKEKLSLNWNYGTDYSTLEEREEKRIHNCIVPYEELDEASRSKDELLVNNILTILRRFESNIKVYCYRGGTRPELRIAGIGHRVFTDDPAEIRKRVKAILMKYSEAYRVVVYTCFAYGSDLLIAECANELGLATRAFLPMPYEKYVQDVKRDTLENGLPFTDKDELRMRHLLAQTSHCTVLPDSKYVYAEASFALVRTCQKAIFIWDGKQTPLRNAEDKPINRGGTYDTLCVAENECHMKKNVDYFVIDCHR